MSFKHSECRLEKKMCEPFDKPGVQPIKQIGGAGWSPLICDLRRILIKNSWFAWSWKRHSPQSDKGACVKWKQFTTAALPRRGHPAMMTPKTQPRCSMTWKRRNHGSWLTSLSTTHKKPWCMVAWSTVLTAGQRRGSCCFQKESKKVETWRKFAKEQLDTLKLPWENVWMCSDGAKVKVMRESWMFPFNHSTNKSIKLNAYRVKVMLVDAAGQWPSTMKSILENSFKSSDDRAHNSNQKKDCEYA